MHTAQTGPALAGTAGAGPALGSRFDWYSATFDDMDDVLVPQYLAASLGATAVAAKGRLGYASCVTLERDDETLARVFMHSARAGEVHIAVSGDACDRVVPVVRRLWPHHRVARADSAFDFLADFEEIDAAALGFAQERGLAYRLVTDSDGGATRYLGSPSSEVTVRVYKKSEQLRKLHPERAALVDDGIVRCELQARPGTKVKGLVATMSADDLWGLGKWTRDFAATFLHFDAQRVATHFARPSDYARALHWLGVQYGPLTRARARETGTEDVVADVLKALGLSGSAQK